MWAHYFFVLHNYEYFNPEIDIFMSNLDYK